MLNLLPRAPTIQKVLSMDPEIQGPGHLVFRLGLLCLHKARTLMTLVPQDCVCVYVCVYVVDERGVQTYDHLLFFRSLRTIYRMKSML